MCHHVRATWRRETGAPVEAVAYLEPVPGARIAAEDILEKLLFRIDCSKAPQKTRLEQPEIRKYNATLTIGIGLSES